MENTNNLNQGEKPKLLPSDFYEENGRKVMTEQYHIRRGYCCGNGCRHCPYIPKAVKGNTTLIEK
jgi:hypothetical protein